ncbi:hypothetical protein N474_20760 [Pseudoalteromonas luteoviolacea CPMOR-2]|uniref:TonB-denpendent receptor n=1 Tax=Pseudoalteromonas luteoviolacea DSM 6061 TaxID=1365250 RepID=A0A166W3I7_9GAMM|nr:TonB-dependent siderophore receptor [Pseudoalteromonas luteoviolacea]KZN35371.1 hypothetical protein N475_18690 [Pseudoalteromonas luteoviolacea DSM 6061]KZN53492.1 hypothetical protein N474_20760 [Pseudoalteromonas luteoviolacea CPMOR-2]MBE0387616.1 outer-membrane receptor for ferric coprogen and ferric-rhodotorulic acid [Pseudoalteromonas luteoviolacea DSM 6061]
MKQYSTIAKAVCIGLLASSSSAVLADDAKLDLERIEVVGKHHRDVGATGLPLAIGDTPQSISIVDSEFMSFHDINSVGDALSHSAGVFAENSLANRSRFVYSRGFEINRYLIDGMGAGSSPVNSNLLDTSIFQSVEVIRGSTGMLQEIGQPSGTVNLVQKRAYNTTGGSVSAEYGSWNKRRAEADVNVALTDDGSVRARTVLVYDDAESFVERSGSLRKVLYGTLTADLTDDLQVSVFTSHQSDDLDAMSNGLPYRFITGERVTAGIELNFYPDWATQSTTQENLMGEVRYQINDKWNVVARTHRSEMNDDHLYTDLDFHLERNGDYFLYLRDNRRDYTSERTEFNINGQFSLFGRDHDLNFTFADTEFEEEYWSYRPVGGAGGNFFAEHAQQPAQAKPEKPAFDYENGALTHSQLESQSLRLALNLNVTDSLNFLVGANYKDIEAKGVSRNVASQRDFSDTNIYFGGVYRFNEQTMVYASYTDISDQPAHYDKNNQLLDSPVGKNKEVGVRYATQDDAFTVDVAYFDISQDNYPVRVAAQDDSGEIYYVGQSGIESKGYEVEVTGHITEQWFASASYADIDVSNPNSLIDRTIIIQPKEVFKFSSFYDFDNALQGLRIGGYLTYAGDRKGFNGLGRGTEYFDVSSNTLLGFSAYYEFNDALSAKFNIHNLLDKEYDAKIAFLTVRPGDPRNYSLQLTYSF